MKPGEAKGRGGEGEGRGRGGEGVVTLKNFLPYMLNERRRRRRKFLIN